jgi:hypothetical protein
MLPTLENYTLQSRITCPHCWHEFAPEDSLWIAEHPDLLGDMRLGDQFQSRFLPTRFTPDGDALDPEGQRTTKLACPNCHLEVPRPLYQIAPVFFSILGAPASGKSYFLASMTWRMREILPNQFAVAMTDTDPISNAQLHEYERQQFLNPDPDQIVKIQKTEVSGDLYDRVNFGPGNIVNFPRPFLFNLQPTRNHPNHAKSVAVSKVMCLYDNAGESFLPGADSSSSPVTRHLALARCLFFLFDPTQEIRFRRACDGISDDPQMQLGSSKKGKDTITRQDTILLEAIQRVRRYAGLREDQLHQRPLIIVVTKWDSWRNLLPDVSNEPPYRPAGVGNLMALDGEQILKTSKKVEALLRKLTPEIVAAAEGFAKSILYVPVSATGTAPRFDSETGADGIAPKDLKPYWVEVPMLYTISQYCAGLVGTHHPKN